MNDTSKTKVLIVDDDQRLLRAYSVKLQNEGFEIETEQDGTKALQHTIDFMPDIVLLDVLLPQKTGWEILAELKQQSEVSSIPVILVSNIGSSEKEIEAKEAGAALYLVKSNTPLADLVSIIKEVVAV